MSVKSIISALVDKMYVKQWSVALAYGTPEEVLENGINQLQFKWIPIDDHARFLADPFIIRKSNGEVILFCEDFHYMEQYGKITAFLLNDQFEVMKTNVILDTGSHLSYPAVYHFEGKYFLIPESGMANELVAYELNLELLSIVSSQVIHNGEPLLDATILSKDNGYWLFATKRGVGSNCELYLYHSTKWQGPYQQVGTNPVANNLSGSRPAGHFFEVNGKVYRPTQNSREYYGKSIIIKELQKLSKIEFKEKFTIELNPKVKSRYNIAIHTINFSNGVIVVDGLRRYFNPFKQLVYLLQKRRKMRLR
jgi:hypothetical protein